MTDIEDASVNGNGEPLETTPETPKSAEPDAASPAAQPAAPTAPGFDLDMAGEPEPTPAVADAEELVAEAPEVAVIAVAAEAGTPDGLTGQLRALSESLDQPTGETAELPEAAEPPEGAESAGSPAEGAEEAVAETAEGTAELPETTEPSETAEGTAEPSEGAEENAETAEGAGPPAEGAEEAVTETAEGTAAESLDDIAPGTVVVVAAEGEAEAALGEVEVPRTTVSWWPFVAYVVVWLAAAAYAVWQLEQLPTGLAAYETNFYSMSVLAGLVLLALGPVLILVVWFASWIGRQGARIGLMFISALLKGAAATLVGAVIWMGALVLVDYLRLGRPF